MFTSAIFSLLPVYCLISSLSYEPVELSNGLISVLLSREYPLILQYKRLDNSSIFGGSDKDERWKITVIKPDRTFDQIRNEDVHITSNFSKDNAGYEFSCFIGDKWVLSFTSDIHLQSDEVIYKIGNVRAEEGYKLHSIDFGKSIRVYLNESVPESSICGGNLGREPDAYFLEEIKSARVREPQDIDMFMICQPGAVAVGYNNLIIHPWRFQCKSQGSNIAEFWCPPYTHTVVAGAGENWTEEDLGGFICKIGILGDYSGDGQIDWRDGASFIRDNLPGGVPLFQEYMRYEANDDFDRFIDVIKRLYYITDGRPQLCLHAAWQYWGWDSEYPAYMEPNDEYGGRLALYNLMREAPKYRCIVSLIHNFDDSYKDSPAWNESIIIRTGDQSLLEATAWAGGRSYINSPFKMVKLGWAKKVIDGLVAQGARIRIFSDVLSAVPERVDHDKDFPADVLANLVLGKFKIIEMLKEKGIAVGSESVTYPFVGKICTAHSMPLGISEDPKVVPLGPFVLHGKMAYQSWGHGYETLLAGVDNTTGWDNDRIYLWAMVLEKYANKPMTNYIRKDKLFRTEFGKDTFVEWDKAKSTIKVVVDGRLITNGKSSFIPKETPNVYLAYSITQEPQVYQMPQGWDDISKLLIYELSDTGEKKVENTELVSFNGDNIILKLKPQTPYRLCYGEEAYLLDKRWRETEFEQPVITWEVDKVLDSYPTKEKPSWIRKATRTDIPGKILYVGCGAKFPTEEQSRRHAASIVARKLTWQVREGYVNRSREYESKTGLDYEKIGFDNWNLGLDVTQEIYSLEKLLSRNEVEWYIEKLESRDPEHPEPSIMYKAYIAVPVTKKEIHDIYVEAIRYNLEIAKKDLSLHRGDETQLSNRIKLWTYMLEEESKKEE